MLGRGTMPRFALWSLWGVSLLVGTACTASSGDGSPVGSAPTPTVAASPSTRPSIAPSASVSPGVLGSPTLLPSSGRILFVIERGGESHPVYLDRVGFHEIPTVADSTLAKAAWASPDSIVFDSERDVRRHVFRMGLDGSHVVELTSGGAIQERPAISPDGSTIAYADVVDAYPGADLGLHLANADGTNPRAVIKDARGGATWFDTSPAFSPDGQWVVFERAVDFDKGIGGLYVVRVDGSGLRRLTDDTLGAGYPRWSPDGTQILFTQHLEAATFAPGPLWVVDIAGGKPTPLTDPQDPGWSFEGDWSPDGSQIVYDYFRPGASQAELRVMNADGTHPSTVLMGGGETPDWGP